MVIIYQLGGKLMSTLCKAIAFAGLKTDGKTTSTENKWLSSAKVTK